MLIMGLALLMVISTTGILSFYTFLNVLQECLSCLYKNYILTLAGVITENKSENQNFPMYWHNGLSPYYTKYYSTL